MDVLMDDFCSDQSGSFSGVGKLVELGSWEQPDFFRKGARLSPSSKSVSHGSPIWI